MKRNDGDAHLSGSEIRTPKSEIRNGKALQQVFLDEDGAAALEFLREHVEPQIPTRGTAPCDSSRLNPFLKKGDGRSRRR